ncbi:MAG: hypothetical protein QMD22_07615 [archaeon]|nr:hypothetical protein [archaeon]
MDPSDRKPNNGNKRALIEKIEVCWFDSPNSSICRTDVRVESNNTDITFYPVPNIKEYNKREAIHPGESLSIKTDFDIHSLTRVYISPADGRWGVQIYESSRGCHFEELHGVPPQKDITTFESTSVIRPFRITSAEWDVYEDEINHSDHLDVYSNGQFSLYKKGNSSSGTWRIEEDQIYLNFGNITIHGKIEGNTIIDLGGTKWIKM